MLRESLETGMIMALQIWRHYLNTLKAKMKNIIDIKVMRALGLIHRPITEGR